LGSSCVKALRKRVGEIDLSSHWYKGFNSFIEFSFFSIRSQSDLRCISFNVNFSILLLSVHIWILLLHIRRSPGYKKSNLCLFAFRTFFILISKGFGVRQTFSFEARLKLNLSHFSLRRYLDVFNFFYICGSYLIFKLFDFNEQILLVPSCSFYLKEYFITISN